MTLDEIEKLAKEQLESYLVSAEGPQRKMYRADDLARFVLTVLPVVRAANAGVDGGGSMADLVDAVDALREKLEGR